MQTALPSRWTARSGLLLATTLAAGCASVPPSSPPVAPSQAVESVAPPPAYVPVIRHGRYTLVELTPTAAQQDLLLQVVDVAVPDTLHASVGDALRHVLQRSGYRLCDGHAADALLTLPLPAAHYRLGPVALRDALLTLGGPTWDLQVDHGTRRVCFTQAQPDVPEPPRPTLPSTGHQAETFPLSTEVLP